MLKLSREFGNCILRGEETFESGMASGDIVVEGKQAKVAEFHMIFDNRGELPEPNLARRQASPTR